MTRFAARLFRLDPGPSGLALRCDEAGLSLAGVALLQKTEAGFEPRSPEELDLLLRSAGADGEPPFALSSSGRAAVAEALNRGDLAKAQMKALFLHAPKLDAAAAARLAEADGALAKGGPSNAYFYEDRNAQGRRIRGGGGGGGGAGPVGQDKARRDGLRGPLSPPHFPPPTAPHVAAQRPQPPATSSTAQANAQANRIQAIAAAQNAAMANPKYQPEEIAPKKWKTHCSEAARTIAMNAGLSLTNILYDSKGRNFDANTQGRNLASPASGYHPVTPAQAQALANQGVIVFGTQHRLPNGHIVTVGQKISLAIMSTLAEARYWPMSEVKMESCGRAGR